MTSPPVAEGVERPLVLRMVAEGDCRLLWTWANDPNVRASAFSEGPIPFEDHERWFSRKLRDPNTVIFIAETRAGAPVGQVRFDVDAQGDAEIDFSVAREWRGRGYGREILEMGAARLFATGRAARVHGAVKESNLASQRSFEAAGFTTASRTDERGTPVVVFVRSRPELATAP